MESEEIKEEIKEEQEAQASEALKSGAPDNAQASQLDTGQALKPDKSSKLQETGAPKAGEPESGKTGKPENPEPEELKAEEKPVEEPESDEPKIEEDRGIYAIRTTANKEKNVASKLYDRIERDGHDISAIIVPGIKGYILVEGSRKDIDKAYRGVAHARGLVAGKTALSEIDHFLVPKPAVTALAVDYIVEVSAGPFKGERAKITRVDKTKNEITIELLEATVPIPITVPAESVRVLEKEPEGKKEKEKKEGEEQETEDPFAL